MSAIPAASVNLKTMADPALYFRLISKSREDDNGCWVWTASRTRNGYGAVQVCSPKRSKIGAHRAMMQSIVGPLESDAYVCHKCDVKLCINPDHLFLGSAGDNARDRQSKGRGANVSGERNPMSLASDAAIAKAVEQIVAGESVKTISERLGVSVAAVRVWLRKRGIRIGRSGGRNGRAKLSESDRPRIQALVAGGMSRVKVAELYSVSDVAIGNMLRGKTWT